MEIELTPAEATASPAARPAPTVTTAELAECTCPDFCERDHDND
jgi:hypothetical protein